MFPILTEHFELKLTDLKFSLRSFLEHDPGIDPLLVMVNLDDYSKEKSGYDLWPYPNYAQVIEKINAGKPIKLPPEAFVVANVRAKAQSPRARPPRKYSLTNDLLFELCLPANHARAKTNTIYIVKLIRAGFIPRPPHDFPRVGPESQKD